jgi:hypothetical protein
MYEIKEWLCMFSSKECKGCRLFEDRPAAGISVFFGGGWVRKQRIPLVGITSGPDEIRTGDFLNNFSLVRTLYFWIKQGRYLPFCLSLTCFFRLVCVSLSDLTITSSLFFHFVYSCLVHFIFCLEPEFGNLWSRPGIPKLSCTTDSFLW